MTYEYSLIFKNKLEHDGYEYGKQYEVYLQIHNNNDILLIPKDIKYNTIQYFSWEALQADWRNADHPKRDKFGGG